MENVDLAPLWCSDAGMPAALEIDREAVRVLVVAIGPRAAAREMGLPEATVQAWSARYGWLEKHREAQEKAASLVRVKEEATGRVQPIATKSPGDALAEVIARDGAATRIGAVRYAKKVVEHAESLPADIGLTLSGDVKSAMQVLAIADGSGAGGSTVVQVAVALRLDME
jgi:hypothetical protein